MRGLSIVAALAALLPVRAQTADYVVLAAFDANDPYDAAAQLLAKHHGAAVVRFELAKLDAVRTQLVAAAPRHVAIVLRPEQLEFAFARRFLQLATTIDDDPFVDFAFGYLTGRTADDAKALAQRGIARKPQPLDRGLATVAVGPEKSMRFERPHVLRRTRVDELSLYCATEKSFPETGRDTEFLRANLPAVQGRDAITFAGHGYPREVVGGPTFAELAGLDLAGAVVLNVACYTGVTGVWYEDDWKKAVTVRREVPPAESFCLELLRTGVVGYVAYVCPRPAGPELDTDLTAMIVDGASLGDARRRDYDKTVLGFLGFGEERMALAPVADGVPFARDREAVRDFMLEGATGGVVFGDPACVPFERRDRDAPVAIEVEAKDDALVVTARASNLAVYTQCADPTARWDDTMALRVYTRVELGERHVTGVVVDEVKLGSDVQPTRVVWAVEDDHGERFLQLKVMFPRKEPIRGALRMTARVLTTAVAADARRRGGEAVLRDGTRRELR